MEIKIDMVAALGSFIFVVFWSARLEFLAKQNAKDIETLRQDHLSLSEELRDDLKSVRNSLYRIEGRLSIREDHEK